MGSGPFAVLLGDELIDEGDELLSRMVSVYRMHLAPVVALLEVKAAETHKYGCATFETTEDEVVVRVTELVEKPSGGKAPFNYAVVGSYILNPSIFIILETSPAGRGREIQLTDALQIQVRDVSVSGGVMGVILKGGRYDSGNKVEYIKAVIELALSREDHAPPLLTPWLKDFVSEL